MLCPLLWGEPRFEKLLLKCLPSLVVVFVRLSFRVCGVCSHNIYCPDVREGGNCPLLFLRVNIDLGCEYFLVNCSDLKTQPPKRSKFSGPSLKFRSLVLTDFDSLSFPWSLSSRVLHRCGLPLRLRPRPRPAQPSTS